MDDADEDVAEDGALEALRKYFGNPRLYDPTRGRLLDWLRKRAVNATHDLMKRARSARDHEVTGLDLARMALAAQPDGEAEANEARRREQRQRFLSELDDPVERTFAEAHLDGAPIPVQAAILGAGHLPEPEQAELVKKSWHRIREKAKWRIRRSAGDAEPDE